MTLSKRQGGDAALVTLSAEGVSTGETLKELCDALVAAQAIEGAGEFVHRIVDLIDTGIKRCVLLQVDRDPADANKTVIRFKPADCLLVLVSALRASNLDLSAVQKAWHEFSLSLESHSLKRSAETGT